MIKYKTWKREYINYIHVSLYPHMYIHNGNTWGLFNLIIDAVYALFYNMTLSMYRLCCWSLLIHGQCFVSFTSKQKWFSHWLWLSVERDCTLGHLYTSFNSNLYEYVLYHMCVKPYQTVGHRTGQYPSLNQDSFVSMTSSPSPLWLTSTIDPCYCQYHVTDMIDWADIGYNPLAEEW